MTTHVARADAARPDAPATAGLDLMRPAAYGIYSDEHVVVERLDLGGGIDAVARSDGRVHVVHSLTSAAIDDDVAEPLAHALGAVTGDHAVFGSAFTGIVLTSDDDPLRAWDRFYGNSVRRIADPSRHGYVDVYRRALHHLEGVPDAGVLDLGCGFGFLAMYLRRLGRPVVAADVDRNTVRLLSRMCRRLAVPMDVVRTDGARLPQLPDRSVGTVLLLHVLEHVDAETGAALVAEATRLARHRVVVAVPYEQQPTSLYGHVRRMDAEQLERLGVRSRWRHRVEEFCGGWLVLDRPLDPS